MDQTVFENYGHKGIFISICVVVAYGITFQLKHIESIHTWNPNDLYFWRSTPQNKAFSDQKKGYLGSRYIQKIYTYIYFIYISLIQDQPKESTWKWFNQAFFLLLP